MNTNNATTNSSASAATNATADKLETINVKSENLINLTPHTIVLFDQNGTEFFNVQPSGTIARIDEETQQTGVFCVEQTDGTTVSIPAVVKTYSDVQNLPDPTPGVVYIVSLLVAQRCPDRKDLWVPDTGSGAVRQQGRIVGTTRLQHV